MSVEKDDDGFLLDPDDWNEDVAIEIARSENLNLTEEHWRLIHLIRNYYFEYSTVPELRKILKYFRTREINAKICIPIISIRLWTAGL